MMQDAKPPYAVGSLRARVCLRRLAATAICSAINPAAIERKVPGSGTAAAAAIVPTASLSRPAAALPMASLVKDKPAREESPVVRNCKSPSDSGAPPATDEPLYVQVMF